MLTQTARSAITKLLIGFMTLALAPHARAASPQRVDLVIALDLTKSTDIKGPDSQTEFQKNVAGVTGVLAQVPAGGHVTVIGITDHSFTQPDILLSAAVPDDPGYFGERLSAARAILLSGWKKRSANLTPTFPATDILGALRLASQILSLHSTGDRKVLILFSDMRNHTRELNLESATRLTVTGANDFARTPAINLHGDHMIALGVDGAGRTQADWERVHQYWEKYFGKSGAFLDQYTVLRETHLLATQ